MVIALRLVATLLLAGLLPPTPSPPGIAAGKPAPSLTAVWLDGKKVADDELHGRPALVVTFVTGCQACRAQLDALTAAYPRYKTKIRFLGIDEHEPVATVTAFVKRMHLPFDIIIDRGDMNTTYAATPLPRTVFVDAKGLVNAVTTATLSQHQLDREFGLIAGT